ncbi:hypothetical protein GIB67_004663 [Kingdonia uniflora]|uniref:Helicase ATP-binding domain-containing protein n=1 Tax=Kingdonia uniflora TaxID=39325 RepID=A0A7J7P4V0_9MAGN|nr:hypothetical protein GIB67_004663 [Kingdonia uniflora]
MEDMISEEEAVQALCGFSLSVRYLRERHNTELRMRTMVDTKALERDELKMQKEWQRVDKELLRGDLKITALKAPGFGERKSQYLDDIAILTGATVIREKVGLSLDKAEKEVLSHDAKVVLTKEVTTIIGNGSTQDAVNKSFSYPKPLQSITMRTKNLIKELPNSLVMLRSFRLEHKLKEKKLRVEDALNATKVYSLDNFRLIQAAVEEGIVVGGDCTLLRLAAKVDAIKLTLDNDEQKARTDIVKRVLSYPLKLIAKNAVLSGENFKYGYNVVTGKYEDLITAGIIDPTKVFKESQMHDDSRNYFELSLVSCKSILPLARQQFFEAEDEEDDDDDDDDDDEAAEEYELFGNEYEEEEEEEGEEDEFDSDVTVISPRFEEHKWERVERVRADVKEFGEGIINLDELASIYDFRMDKFQRLAVQAFLRGSSVVVSAPTSSGKTLIAEAAAVATLAKGRRLFYTTPLKALSNQKYRDFRETFGESNVGLLTGDSAVNKDAPILIMTTEILRNMLYQSVGMVSSGSRLLHVEVIVLDEVHYLSDISRGTVWEEIVIYSPKEVQLLCLSATVANADELAGWIGQEGSNDDGKLCTKKELGSWEFNSLGDGCKAIEEMVKVKRHRG